MCSGFFGGGGKTVVQSPQVTQDPQPVQVQNAGTSETSDRTALNKQRRKRGNLANAIATDRAGTILGGMSDTAQALRKTLG